MPQEQDQPKGRQKFKSLGEGFARKGQTVYVRLRINGKLTWRSTGTSRLAQARKWREKWDNEQWNEKHGIESKGVTLQQSRVTVGELIDDYLEAGCPIIRKRSLKPKSQRTIRGEKYCFHPVQGILRPDVRRALGLERLRPLLRLANLRRLRRDIQGAKQRGYQTDPRWTRAVDLELTVLSNALSLAVRRGRLKTNPLRERGRYTDRSQIRHCRETAPTPDELRQIVEWLENNGHQQPADFAQYLAYSGLRIGEGLGGRWGAVNWAEELIHVKRSKKGLIPWVPILPEMKRLLASMKERASGDLMFPSVLNPDTALDPSAFRRLLAKACRQLGIRHVTPHGLRSYFVTQARQSGLTDAEIAQLIGDKTGPSIIAEVYGDVRPDHLLNIARKIQLTAATRTTTAG